MIKLIGLVCATVIGIVVAVVMYPIASALQDR